MAGSDQNHALFIIKDPVWAVKYVRFSITVREASLALGRYSFGDTCRRIGTCPFG
jgi:hypothetical protein